MKTIATFNNSHEAHMAVSLLAGSGISAHLLDEHTVSIQPGLSPIFGGVKLQVADGDAQRAREVLNLMKDEEGVLACPDCGSENVKIRKMSLALAISLAIGYMLPIPSISKTVDCLDCGREFGEA